MKRIFLNSNDNTSINFQKFEIKIKPCYLESIEKLIFQLTDLDTKIIPSIVSYKNS